MDEQQRARIRDDLKGFFAGELLFDDLSQALYSTDASIFQVRPLGVALPRHEQDVQALVRYAAEQRLPLVPRGAGTGLAGEALGSGLIVDMSRHFRAITEVGDDWVRVQPGVTLAALQTRLAATGRRFAPDPASGGVCTLGGMLATNASGARVLRHGYTRDHVRSLRAVLDNGDAVHVGRELLPIESSHGSRHLADILSTLHVLLEDHRELIQNCQPRTPFNRFGYSLDRVVEGNVLDVSRLLVGSEGTLALFTEATLGTVPIPAGRALVLLGFSGLDTALQAALLARETGPAACDLLDRRLLSLARTGVASQAAALVPAAAEAILLVEYETDSPGTAQHRAQDLVRRLSRTERLAQHVHTAFGEEDLDRLWQVRELALPSLFGIKGGVQPVPFLEDVGVPVLALPEFVRRVQEILQENETTASFLIHAASGQVHTRPFLDLQKPDHVARMALLSERVHSLALELGGTVSTQHGVGLARTSWTARQYGPLYPVLRQVKAIFDPRGIFNPGKIVDPDPNMLAWPLRQAPAAATEPARWQLHWPEAGVRTEINHCNGCGQCRTEQPPQRMCPMFRVTPDEAATPRAKANLLRHLLRPDGQRGELASAQVRAVADLCVNCKMCAHECPAHVNIPKLMLEARAAHVAQQGLDWSERFLARLENFVRWGSAISLIANYTLRSKPFRWLYEKLFGISARRRLPLFAARTFFQIARRRGWTNRSRSGRPCLVYFADLHDNYVDPQVAEAAVLVLRHQGFDVYVPPGQFSSGIAPLAHGDVEAARDIARRNLRLLADLAREGLTIICSEPSAALMFRQDYLDLVDDLDARLVATHTMELTAFLADLHRRGQLRQDFRPLNLTIGHHVPCHLKALGDGIPGPALLREIPGLKLTTIDLSCSGMAGTFGLKEKNYQASRQAGAPMLQAMQDADVQVGSSECSSCRMQIQDALRLRTLHPVQLMALSYGLLPEVQRRLEPLKRDDLVLR